MSDGWDSIEQIFTIPPEIVSALTPAELAEADQLIAQAKTLGHRVINGGGGLDAAIDAMADDLLELMLLVQAALSRGEEEPPADAASDDVLDMPW